MTMSRRTFLLGSLALVVAGCRQNQETAKEIEYISEIDKAVLLKTADDLRKKYRDVQEFEIIRPAQNYLLGPYVYGFDGKNVHVYSKKREYLFKMYEREIDGEMRIVQDFSKTSLQNECLTTGYDPDWKRWHMKVNTEHKTKDGAVITVNTTGVLEPCLQFNIAEYKELLNEVKGCSE